MESPNDNYLKENRKNLLAFLEEYKKIDNFKNKWNRFFKNKKKNSILCFFSVILLGIIGVMISLFFCSEYLNLVISIWLIMIIIVILIEIKNFEEFNSEYILQRDQEINELLKKKKLNSDNINNMIDYFTLEMELDSVVYKESEFLNGISNAGSKIIFLLLGAFIPELIKKNFFLDTYPDLISFYLVLAEIIIVSIPIILSVRLYAYFNRKDKYLTIIKKLVIDLKQIAILNKFKPESDL